MAAAAAVSYSITSPSISSNKLNPSAHKNISCDWFQFLKRREGRNNRLRAVSVNCSDSGSAPKEFESNFRKGLRGKRSSLESLFCYDKSIPEEIIDKPVGISLAEKAIGDNPRCTDCQAKGAVLCATCAGTGLYVDSILESQGIIVKVRCLGCGGTGNIMCPECGGRGHLGPK